MFCEDNQLHNTVNQKNKTDSSSRHRETGNRWTDLLAWRVQQPHRMGGASRGSDSTITSRFSTVESAHTVKAEAVSTVIRAVEDGRRRIARHWLTRSL